MYTLAVASLGRRVVAVDMMADNLAFVRRSLGLANISSEAVTLVHNAVTDTPGQAAVPVRDTAQGGHTALHCYIQLLQLNLGTSQNKKVTGSDSLAPHHPRV